MLVIPTSSHALAADDQPHNQVDPSDFVKYPMDPSLRPRKSPRRSYGPKLFTVFSPPPMLPPAAAEGGVIAVLKSDQVTEPTVAMREASFVQIYT